MANSTALWTNGDTNAGGDNHHDNHDSQANSHCNLTYPTQIKPAELFLLIPKERLEQYPTKRVQVTP